MSDAIGRREFVRQMAALGIVLPTMHNEQPALRPTGDWPTPRQNHQLTGIQTVPGRMKSAPKVAATIEFARGQGYLTPIALTSDAEANHVIEIADGVLRCWHNDGKLLWESHPKGLNFESLVAARDFDGDGKVELALTCGRPTQPFGAAVVVEAATGKIRFRHDVEPMSYWWMLQVGNFLPEGEAVGEQIIVTEHAYPPDEKFGYMALFEFPKAGATPKMRWRYDFDAYTCFQTILMADVNGDGADEICVETHSRMWVLDARTGKVDQFIGWDVAPANVRSYGLIRFQDLNGDGRPDFFCIADFSQHHEVLLNEGGKLKRAWAHGWEDSVSTAKIATTYPDPPIADVDGDGKLEMVLSMFHAEDEQRWMVRVYDAVTGVLKAKMLDRIAISVTDLDKDGHAEIVTEICTDPTRTITNGSAVLKWQEGNLAEIWQDPTTKIIPPTQYTSSVPRRGNLVRAGDFPLPSTIYVQSGDKKQRLQFAGGKVTLLAEAPPAPPPPPNLSKIPGTLGPFLQPPLVADIDGDGKPEVIHHHNGRVVVYRLDSQGKFTRLEEFVSDAPPALADLDGDGKLEMVIGTMSPTADPVIEAIRFAPKATRLWKVSPPKPDRTGLPFENRMYFQTGRFLGRKGDDVYAYVCKPLVRSMMLSGADGSLVWDKGDIPGMERYFAPTKNMASVWDFNGDGKDDLVFTNPDYYCVASGPTGEALLGPINPTKIFSQPSLGLYTSPAILANNTGEPSVCLVNGHYFIGAMSLTAKPNWFRLPLVGEARAGSEGFLRLPDGTWLMGIGRQDGQFVCTDIATGKTRWEWEIGATPSDIVAGDVDGDGKLEFVFGTSHGQLIALGERDGKPHLTWKAELGARVGTPVIADVNGDGFSEILAPCGDGRLHLLQPSGGR